jgi:hypothetical protein
MLLPITLIAIALGLVIVLMYDEINPELYDGDEDDDEEEVGA